MSISGSSLTVNIATPDQFPESKLGDYRVQVQHSAGAIYTQLIDDAYFEIKIDEDICQAALFDTPSPVESSYEYHISSSNINL